LQGQFEPAGLGKLIEKQLKQQQEEQQEQEEQQQRKK
jgi:hypothetical protein